MPKAVKGQRFGGRVKGTPNKVTADLRRVILEALEAAGGPDGSLGYLKKQAETNPTSFMTLVGKVLPTQVTGDGGGPVISRVEFVVVDPQG